LTYFAGVGEERPNFEDWKSMTGLVISGFGLLFLLLAAFSFAQGLRDLRSIAFCLGLFFLFAGRLIYQKNKKKEFINKRQVARLFGVSKATIELWLQDGKLPQPKGRFGRQKWDYEEIVLLVKRKRKI
jgi:predicted DNA-binding transcriptional regulator AlpA